MVSDQGGPFVSELARYIYHQLGINKKITTAYHPQANGVTERFNGTLKQLLKVWCNEEQDDWDELVTYATFVYNTNYHRVVQEVPFFITNAATSLIPCLLLRRTPNQFESIILFSSARPLWSEHSHACLKPLLAT
jgi:transposase InsO family protein